MDENLHIPKDQLGFLNVYGPLSGRSPRLLPFFVFLVSATTLVIFCWASMSKAFLWKLLPRLECVARPIVVQFDAWSMNFWLEEQRFQVGD